MSDDLSVTGATVGSPDYIVVYYDVSTDELYNVNGQLYGNKYLSTFLWNDFILEIHYVSSSSNSSSPEYWLVWEGVKNISISSTVSFDDNYIHAVEGYVSQGAVAGSSVVRLSLSGINKDTLYFSGNLIFNPFSATPKTVSYSSFSYISGNDFEFKLDSGLPINVYGTTATVPTPVRVSEPLYLFVDSDSIYEANIPERYNEGVFKIPMSIKSRKLLKELDYSDISSISGKVEHKLYTNTNSLSGIIVSGSTYSRKQEDDKVAIDSNDGITYKFNAWFNGSTTYWTKGNDLENGVSVYTVFSGTASVAGTANTITINVPVLFRTFSFPFVVQNLIDF